MTGMLPGAAALRVLAIANQKGGVGKTTTAINLGTALAAVGQKVLILDLDPQGNASTGVGVAEDARHLTTFSVLSGKSSIAVAAMPTLVPNLSIVPANSDLVGLESEMMVEANRPFRLRDAVASEVRAFFGPKVYETMIPRNVRVAEAPSFGKPILLYDYECPGSQAYIRLATEIIEREQRLRAA